MLGLVNCPSDISLSRANQSQAKFKSAMGSKLLQSWVNLTIVLLLLLPVVVTINGAASAAPTSTAICCCNCATPVADTSTTMTAVGFACFIAVCYNRYFSG